MQSVLLLKQTQKRDSGTYFTPFSSFSIVGFEQLNVSLLFFTLDRSNHHRRSVKKMFLKVLQNSQENTCARVFLISSVAQVFSCEFCQIFKNTFFDRKTPLAASGSSRFVHSAPSTFFKQ